MASLTVFSSVKVTHEAPMDGLAISTPEALFVTLAVFRCLF